jgi:hypothetical protein
MDVSRLFRFLSALMRAGQAAGPSARSRRRRVRPARVRTPDTTVLTAMLIATAASAPRNVSPVIALRGDRARPRTNENSPTWPARGQLQGPHRQRVLRERPRDNDLGDDDEAQEEREPAEPGSSAAGSINVPIATKKRTGEQVAERQSRARASAASALSVTASPPTKRASASGNRTATSRGRPGRGRSRPSDEEQVVIRPQCPQGDRQEPRHDERERRRRPGSRPLPGRAGGRPRRGARAGPRRSRRRSRLDRAPAEERVFRRSIRRPAPAPVMLTITTDDDSAIDSPSARAQRLQPHDGEGGRRDAVVITTGAARPGSGRAARTDRDRSTSIPTSNRSRTTPRSASSWSCSRSAT